MANGVVFVGRNEGEIFAWSTRPCGQQYCPPSWTGLTQDPIANSSPTVVNGTLYFGNADLSQGRLYVFTLPQ